MNCVKNQPLTVPRGWWLQRPPGDEKARESGDEAPTITDKLLVMVARSRALRVVRAIARNGQTALVARRPVAAGETVLRLAGNIIAEPTRYTLQLGEDQHIEPPLVSETPLPSETEDSLWRFTNHSSRGANTYVKGRAFVAREPIAEGDEITFDYNTTEYDMAAPFPCWETGSMVRGYAHLSPSERGPIAKFVAPHVLRLAEQETGEDCSPHLLRRAEEDASLKVEAA